MSELTEFLDARVAEDEATARKATASPWVHGMRRRGEPGKWRGIEGYSVLAARTRFLIEEFETVADSDSSADVAHIARHDPARVLAECEAKRRIITLHTPFHVTTTNDGLNWDYRGCGTCLQPDDVADGETWWPCPTLRALASIWRDHTDYDGKWRP